MERRIRSQSQTRFLELAFAANPFATAGLVPGHGHVHEPLEEIALLGLGGAPRVLELFVRGEELAAPDQLEAPLERLSGRL